MTERFSRKQQRPLGRRLGERWVRRRATGKQEIETRPFNSAPSKSSLNAMQMPGDESFKSSFFSSHGNVAPVYTSEPPPPPPLASPSLLNFCFRHQTFMRFRMIRRGLRKTCFEITEVPATETSGAVENQDEETSRWRAGDRQGGELAEGREGGVTLGGRERMGKERRGGSRPKSKGRENLARRSVGGRKEVPRTAESARAAACDPSSHKAFDKAAIGISIERVEEGGQGVGMTREGRRRDGGGSCPEIGFEPSRGRKDERGPRGYEEKRRSQRGFDGVCAGFESAIRLVSAAFLRGTAGSAQRVAVKKYQKKKKEEAEVSMEQRVFIEKIYEDQTVVNSVSSAQRDSSNEITLTSYFEARLTSFAIIVPNSSNTGKTLPSSGIVPKIGRSNRLPSAEEQTNKHSLAHPPSPVQQ
ncbi:hypothetical protein WN55_08920 [Dufourea novaeangliae]|uniref:Uncharacterized protein n=1 Tax=Dufourea novaeangliae TaxID=178035 RepID=A0A154P529_DUFNO|nr:hypothetical protein WN55_08920 [Dufourea novaeangliae]